MQIHFPLNIAKQVELYRDLFKTLKIIFIAEIKERLKPNQIFLILATYKTISIITC